MSDSKINTLCNDISRYDGAYVIETQDHGEITLAEAVDIIIKSDACLRDELTQLANFNPDWDQLQATREALKESNIVGDNLRAEIVELNNRIDASKQLTE